MSNNNPISSKFQEAKQKMVFGIKKIQPSKVVVAMTLLLFCVIAITGFKFYFNIKNQKPPIESEQPKSNPSDEIIGSATSFETGIALRKIDNIEEVRQLFEKQDTQQTSGGDGLRRWGAGQNFPIFNGFEGKVAPEMMSFDASLPLPTPSSYSKTNVQVEGIDEADIIKNDGKYMYVATPSTKKILIVEAYPAENMKIVSTINSGGSPINLFLQDDKLVVFGFDDSFYNDPLYQTFIRRSQYTFVEIYDVKDKKNPKIIRNLHLEGSYVTARAIDDTVYMITENYTGVYYSQEPPLPRIYDDRTLIENENKQSIYRMPGSEPLNLTITATAIPINGQSGTNINAEYYLLPQLGSVYMSNNALYVTHTKRIDEELILLSAYKEFLYDRLPHDYKKRIGEINEQEYYILSDYEKKYKIRTIYERYMNGLSDEEIQDIQKRITIFTNKYIIDNNDLLVQTVIHRFSRESDSLRYTGSGAIHGTLSDQFSLDEYDGNLRVATTRETFMMPSPTDEFLMERRESTNSVFILDQKLAIIGQLEDLAPGERIYSTRFIGERLYMVTFKNIDPFFVIDLKNPRRPLVLGYLKIPGFSEYLHPYKDSFVIGLGRETTTNEYGAVLQEGLKLSLFDVSNVSEPKEIDTKIIGGRGSHSNALDDHKAFFFVKEKNLLGIPVTLTKATSQDNWGSIDFQGAILFDISDTGFKLNGRLSHEPIKTNNQNNKLETYNISNLSPIKRIHYINDRLYTLSDNRLQANALPSLKIISNVIIQEEYGNQPPVPLPYIKNAPIYR